MSPFRFIFPTLFATVFLISCNYGIVKKTESEEAKQEETTFKTSILELGGDGYFIVARGYKFADHLVSTATVSDYSHAVMLDHTNQQVYEATAEGIHTLPLDSFIHKCHKMTLVKPFGYTHNRALEALACCKIKEGVPYDFLGTVGIDRTNKYYCSELIVECYTHLTDSLKIPKIITPGKVLDYGENVYISPDRKIKK